MIDQPSEAALRKACEVLELEGLDASSYTVALLARHFDAEDKAAREAVEGKIGGWEDFTRRHILPDLKPTLRSILLDESLNVEGKERAIRDAGLLRE